METEKNNKNKYYYNLFQGTKILTNDEKKAIAKWIKPYHNLKFQLLYQATRDGFSEDKFHSKCDYKGPTVFILVGQNGRRFGGFTTVSWNKENKEYQDDNSFAIRRLGSYTLHQQLCIIHLKVDEHYIIVLAGGYFTADLGIFGSCL